MFHQCNDSRVSSLLLLNVLLLTTIIGFVQSHEDDRPLIGFSYETLAQGLPKGLSDITATKDPDSGVIYIAGGCDAPLGNVWNDEIGTFACDSLSDALYKYDVNVESYVELAPMPQPRYRHVAVFMDGNLWIHGGRDVPDNLLADVDVYQEATNTWITFKDTPTEYVLSDHGAFPNYNTKAAHICNGYDQNYTALNNCFAIDTVASLASFEDGNPSLTIVPLGPTVIPRGDIAIVANNTGALLTGGFSQENDWCEPYVETEEYSFETDTWSTVSEMNVPRGDKALVELNGHVFAFGGERELTNICELKAQNKTPGPDQNRVAVDDVEMYHYDTKTWVDIEDLPSHRFRFAAVSFDDTDKIYTFGGQLGYDASCNCFASTNEIIVYTEKFDTEVTDTPTGGEKNESKPTTSGIADATIVKVALLIVQLICAFTLVIL